VLALTALGAVGIVLWGRSRSRGASWSAHAGDLRRRTLIALDDVVAQGSVVAGQIEALAAEARDLERHASGEQATASIAPVRSALDELAEALEADRTLRLASPPPSPDQLAYSDALIRQQVTRLQEVLRSQ
jgi:predicted AAA+ superfamily ATPase